MTLWRLVFTDKGLRILWGLQIAVAAVVIAGIGLSAHRFHAVFSKLSLAQAQLKQCQQTISQTKVTTSQRGKPTNCYVEPPMERTKCLSTFIRQVTNVAERTGCTLNSITPKSPESATTSEDESVKYTPTEVGIDMSASYSGVDSFVDNLSRLPKVIKITRIHIARKSLSRTTREIKLDTRLVLVLCTPENAT